MQMNKFTYRLRTLIEHTMIAYIKCLVLGFIVAEATAAIPQERQLGGLLDNTLGAVGLTAEKVDGTLLGGLLGAKVDYSYYCSIRLGGSQVCAGAIISPYHILTAAHCVSGVSPKRLSVRAGSGDPSLGVEIGAETTYIHPNYDSSNLNADIAVIKLRNSFQITANGNIQIIPLPEYVVEVPPDTEGIISGPSLSLDVADLVQVELGVKVLTTITKKQCGIAHPLRTITDTMFCATGLQARPDCSLDIGGPLVINENVYGILIWVDDCADPSNPVGFTKVSYFVKWIIEQVKKD